LKRRHTQKEKSMNKRMPYVFSALFLGVVAATSYAALTSAALTNTTDDGVVRTRSVYPLDETVVRLKQDIAGKGIMFFSEIDQAKLAAGAGITLRPSVLLTFGNPPLGTQFLSSNQNAGLDWPVRLLVFENEKGEVWTAYTDFSWIAHRHGIKDRDAQFKMASGVAASITSSVTK
jgi:uncharacterized protein (DUF302 family)